MADGAQGNGI